LRATAERAWMRFAIGSVGVATTLALAFVLGAGPAVSPDPVAAQGGGGPSLLHVPMRWCVLEGTRAARDPDRAVLTRIARGSSILGPKAGITLRGAVNRTLADSLGFPVIPDPRRAIGRPGDVRVPVESTAEFWLVAQRCEKAWDDLRKRAGQGSRFGAVAKGPIAVIIRDFVGGNGRPYTSVWGYAFAANTNPGYCSAGAPRIDRASGGMLLVVDSSDGFPRAISDRRLIAHEVGHILKLGHGDGLDNNGNRRIDKFCDDGENPDVSPGSLMSASLSYEGVTDWQRRLPRSVAVRHPASMLDHPIIRIPPRIVVSRPTWMVLEKIANDGSRTVTRRGGPTRQRVAPGPAMRPLPPLINAGMLGDDVPDDPRDNRDDDFVGPGCSDLTSMGLSVDETSGDIFVQHETRNGVCEDGVITADGGVDVDGDPGTGVPTPGELPGELPGDLTLPLPELPPGSPPLVVSAGTELITRAIIDRGIVSAMAWRWDDVNDDWLELSPPPVAEIGESFGEDAASAFGSSIVLRLSDPEVGIGDAFRMAGSVHTQTPSGDAILDSLGTGDEGEMVSMSLRSAEYPVCGVDRDALFPGHADRGGVLTLETYGFGRDGPVSIYLGDRATPVATGDYTEIPDDPWPWVTEVRIPADVADGLHMIQVALDGTGLTADCPVFVGQPDGDAASTFPLWEDEPAEG
jgi:hypothetical protein